MKIWKLPGCSKDPLPSTFAQPKAAHCSEGNGVPAVFPTGPMPVTSWHGPLQKLSVFMSSRIDCPRTEMFIAWLHLLPLGLNLPGSPGKAPIQLDRFPGRKSQVSEHLTEI